MLKILTYSISNEKFIGMQADETLINFTGAWGKYVQHETKYNGFKFNTVVEMIEAGVFTGEILTGVLRFLEENRLISGFAEKRDIKFEPPVQPSKVLALARNYCAHARELGNEPVEEPIFFTKTVNTILPHQGDIVYPKIVDRVDHEIELGIVIGKGTKSASPEQALSNIAGYTIVNDITARNLQKADISNEMPWVRSKNFDTFLPVGPFIVPKDFVKDPGNLELVLTVNGETRQKGNTKFMINNGAEIISYISQYMTLFPGDIICSGTPEGVSPLKPGDLVEAGIEGIGTLVNRVVSE